MRKRAKLMSAGQFQNHAARQAIAEIDRLRAQVTELESIKIDEVVAERDRLRKPVEWFGGLGNALPDEQIDAMDRITAQNFIRVMRDKCGEALHPTTAREDGDV